MNEYEIGLEDRTTKKRWAGENYGWQSPESFNKLYTEGKLNPAQQAIDRVTSTIATAVQQDPIMGSMLEFASGVAKTTYQVLPQQMQQSVQWGLQQSQTAAENIAGATGLPVSLTDPTLIAEIGMGLPGAAKGATKVLKTVGKDLMTPPPSAMAPAMALAGSGGSVRLANKMDQLSPQMMPITITDPKLIAPGVKEGIAKTPKYAGPLKERATSIRKELEKHFPQPDKLARERSTLVIDPSDPRAYKKRQYMEALPEGVPGFGEKYMHQHHLFPKGGSGAFLERMDELIANGIADEDDLVNMFAFAETLDLTMGDVLSNMLNTPVEAHLAKGGIHSTLRTRGLEKPVKSLKAKASEANNATELMELFKDYLIEDVVPSKNIAKEINDNYLKIKGVIKAPERNAMEDFIEQLRKRGA